MKKIPETQEEIDRDMKQAFIRLGIVVLILIILVFSFPEKAKEICDIIYDFIFK